MNARSITTYTLCSALILVANTAAAQLPVPRAVGAWQGMLAVPGMKLRLGLEIAAEPTGGLRGSMISIDQANATIPASIVMQSDSLIVTGAAAGIRYVGVLDASGDTLRGIFTQGGSLPLTFVRVAAIAKLTRPQEPKPPFPYRSDSVSFESVPGVRLAGTVTTPNGPGPFPAVVLVTGSGPQDRDETIAGHKPFWVLADHLARHGIASLRMDDRGVGGSTGNAAMATSADFANDAEAAVRFLQVQPGIARSRVGIIGHSEGALIAPIVAARSANVAFIVMLAGPGVRGDSILYLQTRALMVAAGTDSARMQATMRFNRAVYDVARSDADSATRVSRLLHAANDYFTALPDSVRSKSSAASLARSAMQGNTPWLRYFISYDPAPTLRQVRVPVLALNGTLDIQVAHKENLDAIAAALKAGGNRKFRTAALPGLNHLFQTARTGGIAEYQAIEETFAPVALNMISDWIRATLR